MENFNNTELSIYDYITKYLKDNVIDNEDCRFMKLIVMYDDNNAIDSLIISKIQKYTTNVDKIIVDDCSISALIYSYLTDIHEYNAYMLSDKTYFDLSLNSIASRVQNNLDLYKEKYSKDAHVYIESYNRDKDYIVSGGYSKLSFLPCDELAFLPSTLANCFSFSNDEDLERFTKGIEIRFTFNNSDKIVNIKVEKVSLFNKSEDYYAFTSNIDDFDIYPFLLIDEELCSDNEDIILMIRDIIDYIDEEELDVHSVLKIVYLSDIENNLY